ncbi:MAG: hypothetical protein HYY10_04060 [Candidatus Liptonbacteria bacterium]|nr:hypothetical protein [Candidatus Liptonbacteria bacterium]
MKWEGLLDSDRVVIPAHNEEASIGLVVGYLMEHGLRGEQLLIVDSNCTDGTVQAALSAARAYQSDGALRVVQQSEMLKLYTHKFVVPCGTVEREATLRNAGKGAAMYAAVLALKREGHSPESRVFFLDGDITNPGKVDMIGCLLRAWERKPNARIAKLASAGRDNNGMLSFINTLPRPYNQLSNLAWPLCGQQSLRLGDLQRIPFPTQYSVEVALLAVLAELYGGECFSQEPIPAPLVEEAHPDDLQRYVRMFTSIMLFLKAVVTYGPLDNMGRSEIDAWNRGSWRTVTDIGVPHVASNGNVRETLVVDELLPPVNSLV